MNFQTGYRRNPERRGLRGFVSSRIASPPTSASVERFAPSIFDQGQTGSCVGHARSRGLYVSRAAQGKPLTFVPSPVDIYRIARCYERWSWTLPLQDSGCDPVDTLDAIKTWGVRPMVPLADRYSDADSATVNDLPTLGDLEDDSDFTFTNDYQIVATGTTRIDLVKAALAGGSAVCFDVAGGSDQWQNYSGGLLKGDGSPLDHYVVALGYTTAGGFRVWGHNSWGALWGLGGAFEGDESLLHAAGDIIVCVEGDP